MQYFLHVIGESTYEDKNGMHFADEGEAIAYAAVIVRELAQDGSLPDICAGGRSNRERGQSCAGRILLISNAGGKPFRGRLSSAIHRRRSPDGRRGK
jgi:hypothetical protein